VQLGNREIKLRGDGLGHFSIFANRVASTMTIEDTSSNFNVGTAGTVLVAIARTGNVGIGTQTPDSTLQVNGEIHAQTVRINNYVSGGSAPLCANTTTNQIGVCNASSLRYKTQVQSFGGGLDLIRRLRPIAFTWKQSGARDIGLGAEEVDQVEPLLTFRNDKGEIEGVKYNQLSAVFINAFKEQQRQITLLRKQNAALGIQLKKLGRAVRQMAGKPKKR